MVCGINVVIFLQKESMMSRKTIIMFGMVLGSIVGSIVGSLLGAGILSFTSLFMNAGGAIAGIWLAYRLTRYN